MNAAYPISANYNNVMVELLWENNPRIINMCSLLVWKFCFCRIFSILHLYLFIYRVFILHKWADTWQTSTNRVSTSLYFFILFPIPGRIVLIPLSWLHAPVLFGPSSKPMRLLLSDIYWNTAHKVEGVLVLCWRLCIRLKRLLSCKAVVNLSDRFRAAESQTSHKLQNWEKTPWTLSACLRATCQGGSISERRKV